MIGRVISLLGLLFVWSPDAIAAPSRVVSMNLCTDHLAYRLAGPGQLISVSYLSGDPSSSLIADEIPEEKFNHGLAEEILRLKPDLVVAGTYSTRTTVQLLRRLGVRVEEFEPARNFDDIVENIRRMGQLLAQEEAASALIHEFEEKLKIAALRNETPDRQPLLGIYSMNSYVAGAASLESKMTEAAGFRHMGSELGMTGSGRLSLESLILTNPNYLMTWHRRGDISTRSNEMLRHPALTNWFAEDRRLYLDERNWICGTPNVMDGIIALQAERIRRGQ